MKKSFLVGLVASLSVLLPFIPSNSYAASQDECAIWICLPGGFPSGCGGAKSEFKKRVKKGKSPLPAFSSCAINYDSSMSYKQGREVFQPAETCNSWLEKARGCTPTPARWVKDGVCKSPIHCQQRRYIDIFVDGQAVGSTYNY